MADMNRLRELTAINRAIASSLGDDEVLRRVVEQAAVFAAAHASVLVLVNGEDPATVRACVGVDEDKARRFQAPVDERIGSKLRELMGAQSEDTFLGVPVVSRGRPVGLLAVCRRGLGSPRPDEELLLSALADQAVIALERAEHSHRIRQGQERGQEALRIIAARARCILWYAEVEDRGGRRLHWDLKLFDEESAQRFFPVPIPPGLSYVQAWYESRLPEDKYRMGQYGDSEARAGRSYRQEFRCRRLDGEVRWLSEDVQIEALGPGRWRAVGVCTDITERKRAEQRLATQHTVTRILAESVTLNEPALKILRAICEHLGWEVGALWSVDRSHQVLRCSEVHRLPSVRVPWFEAISRERTFERGIGLAGRVWASGEAAWIPDVVKDDNFPPGSIAAAEGLHGAFGFPILRNDEVLGVMEFFSSEIREPDEDLLQMMMAIGSQIGQFIERKRAEEALRESEERYRSLAEATTSVVWTTDAEGRFVTPQPSWAGFTGQTWGELRDFGWTNALHPDDRERVRGLWERACASKTVYQSDGRLWHAASHSYRHFAARGVPILEPDGSVREWIGTLLDVDDRKRAMEGTERQREDLQSLIMQSPVPFAVLKGPDLVCEMANAAYLEVVGGRDVLDKPLLQALPEFGDQGFDEVLRGVMRAGEPVVGREVLIMLEREGRLQEAYWTFIFSPLRDSDGAVNRVVALCEDVTEQRRLLNELVEADRRKDEFLAMLAHELRNPLAPLRTSVQLLRRNERAAPDLHRAIDVIDRQVQQLVRLVNDLLDVSRITLDKLELRKARVELALVVQGAVEASRPLIDQCGHELTVDLPSEPIELDADLTRLAQVFLNLLNNAAKYTERGGRIRLSARREGGTVVVTVQDSGIGIAAEMLPRVFEMFIQGDPSLDGSHGGLGIGLTLVKRLVQMHGGSIEARSEGPGRGSEFVVRLPVASESSPGAHPVSHVGEQPAPASRHRILVVDDNRDAAETLAELLELTGNDLRTAYDGLEAVKVAGEFRPDVLLLDIGMPELNGYEVARRIREQPWGQGMVLVALTGWGQEADRRRSREAGFDHHMTKPVEPDALLRLLSSIGDGRCSAQ